MSEIALYNVLTKLGAAPDEAKEAVADFSSSKEVATKADFSEVKADIKDMRHYIDATIAKQDARLTWRMVVLGIAIIGVIKYL